MSPRHVSDLDVAVIRVGDVCPLTKGKGSSPHNSKGSYAEVSLRKTLETLLANALSLTLHTDVPGGRQANKKRTSSVLINKRYHIIVYERVC